jgi:hypothetical protein
MKHKMPWEVGHLSSLFGEEDEQSRIKTTPNKINLTYLKYNYVLEPN